MEQQKSSFNLWLISIGLCALIPSSLAMLGVLTYFDFENPTHREGLHIVGYANYYSLFLWIAYFAVLVGTWKKTTNATLLITSFPFLFLGSSYLLGIIVGVL